MNKNEIISENLDLLNEFMKLAFDNPQILDEIPLDSELIILPENDPELLDANLKIKKSLEKKGQKVVVVKMRKPEKIPLPQIETVDMANKSGFSVGGTTLNNSISRKSEIA